MSENDISSTRARAPFSPATQQQIVRANQKDVYHVSQLREQTESVLRSVLGTRWLTRWEKEVDLISRLVYFGTSSILGAQTLGEEYVDTWQYDVRSRSTPSTRLRALLLLLPALPAYIRSRLASRISPESRLSKLLSALPYAAEAITEINLAVFYLSGSYYTISNRILSIRRLSSIPPDPNSRPPSYSFLGVLISMRLLYKLAVFLKPYYEKNILTGQGDVSVHEERRPSTAQKETYIDTQPVSILAQIPVTDDTRPDEDSFTMLDTSLLTPQEQAVRRCALCLEERMESCATECGHLFCWRCAVGWAREKPECPLCRQALDLTRLLPIYNL
ncbi:hypothetical protein BOTBODRAFT_34895, partial [Botryobasidium botryosum FD-172 SS1]